MQPDALARNVRDLISQASEKANRAVAAELGTHDLRLRIEEYLEAWPGRPLGANADSYVALIGEYVASVPRILESWLLTAQDPSAPERDILLELTRLAGATFLDCEIIPDSFGLGGLLDNAYLVHQFAVQPNFAQTHQLVRLLIGEAIAQQLEDKGRNLYVLAARNLATPEPPAPQAAIVDERTLPTTGRRVDFSVDSSQEDAGQPNATNQLEESQENAGDAGDVGVTPSDPGASGIETINSRISLATANEKRTGSLTTMIARQFSGPDHNVNDAQISQYAALLRAYVEHVPEIIGDLRGRGANLGSDLARYVNVGNDPQLLGEFFSEKSDLLALLPIAYLFHQIHPESDWQEVHQLARTVIGADAATQKDREAAVLDSSQTQASASTPLGAVESESQPGLQAPAKTEQSPTGNVSETLTPAQNMLGTAAKPASVPTATTGANGPCEFCQHVRRGVSVARATFDAMLDILKPRVQAAYGQKMETERQTSSQFFDERQNLQRFREAEYSTEAAYTRCPTDPGIQYCGIDEVNGKYYSCEVRNLDRRCVDFVRKRSDSAAHSCKSCSFNLKQTAKMVQVLEDIAGTKTKGSPSQVRDQIRDALQHQAETELQDCVDAGGILTTRPGTLPICEAFSAAQGESGEPRYIVGPVVNISGRCQKWTGGTNGSAGKIGAELESLMARAQAAVHEYRSPAFLDDNVVQASSQRQSAAGNAQADVMEFCLLHLGVDRDFAESMGSQFTGDVYYAERVRNAGLQPGTGAGPGSSSMSGAPGESSGAAAQPQGFLVTINTTYKHPRDSNVSFLIYQYPPYFTAQVMTHFKQDLFDLSRFPPGTWTQLAGQRGPIPIGLAVSGPPYHQFYAMWL